MLAWLPQQRTAPAMMLSSAVPPVVYVSSLDASYRHVVPALDSSAQALSKQGAIHLVSSLTQRLGTRLVPYLLLLVVPLMGRMSDPVVDVRQPASATFAAVVALLPLAQVCTSHALSPLLHIAAVVETLLTTSQGLHISCPITPIAHSCGGGPAAACSGMHTSGPVTAICYSCGIC